MVWNKNEKKRLFLAPRMSSPSATDSDAKALDRGESDDGGGGG
jgi:hypothetical protein